MIRGIGPVYARRLVQLFGTEVFDIIEASPARLREVGGIGPKRMARITSAWADQKVIREIMVFLHSHGVGTARAVRIFKTYGTDAVQVMTENPYRLARDIWGIGFKTADTIAAKLGIERTAMIRVQAGISFALTEAMGQGHCGLPMQDLTALAETLLEVPSTLIEEAIALEAAEGTVIESPVGDAPGLFLAGLFHAERSIAERLRTLMAGPLPWPEIDADKALPWIESRTGLSLAPSQAEALRLALRSKVLVITGGPGVGKTTLVNSILRILGAKGVKLLLCAPTGRAAKRMSEATGLEARPSTGCWSSTQDGRLQARRGEPARLRPLVVDESSMIDVPLMQALLQGGADEAGSSRGRHRPAALGGTGPGAGRPDRLGRGAVVRLTEVFRQAAQSRIIASAHRINQGEMPDLGSPEPGSTSTSCPRGARAGGRAGARAGGSRIPRASGSTRSATSRCSAP
jgi:exodeoxyribonuclease V alpha subunit